METNKENNQYYLAIFITNDGLINATFTFSISEHSNIEATLKEKSLHYLADELEHEKLSSPMPPIPEIWWKAFRTPGFLYINEINNQGVSLRTAYTIRIDKPKIYRTLVKFTDTLDLRIVSYGELSKEQIQKTLEEYHYIYGDLDEIEVMGSKEDTDILTIEKH